jgi:hypothetical protein
MVRLLTAAFCVAVASASAEPTRTDAIVPARMHPGLWQETSEGRTGRATLSRVPRLNQNEGNDLVPALKPFAFLHGDWEGVPGPSGETGAFSFKPGAQGHILVRMNFASYPASAGKPASRHDDLMVIAPDGDTVRADYFDSEGHIIRYTVRPVGPGEVVFTSEVKPNEPRYRLSYKSNGDASVAGQFEVAPPGEPESFKPYLTWTGRRR